MSKQNGNADPAVLEQTVGIPRKLNKVESLALLGAMQQLGAAQAQLHEVYDLLGLDRTKQYNLKADGTLAPVGGR